MSSVETPNAGESASAIADDLLYAYLRANGQVGKQLRLVTQTVSAGADISVTVSSAAGSTNVIWIPIAINGTFTANATVANRNIGFTATLNGNVYARWGTQQAVVATQSWAFSLLRGYGDHQNSNTTVAASEPLSNTPLIGGSTIASSTSNLQGADAWTAVVIYVLELTQLDVDQLTDWVQRLRRGAPRFDIFPGVELGL